MENTIRNATAHDTGSRVGEGHHHDELAESIAVVGLGARLPGAPTVEQFWQNMREGKESISRFSDEELLAAGIDPLDLEDPDYVKASAIIEDADRFDASFFGFSPREASILDPQHRLFLECAWESLEDAGYDPTAFDGAIGVYAGCFMNKYLLHNLYTNRAFLASPDAMFARVSNDKDFLATRVSYLLDLRGPSLTVQTACSTSLVATHLACQALLCFDCDMALVGGVALNVPLVSGYRAVDAGFFAPDGHCRAFDASANGCLPGYGAGIVVLRRLADALESRDHVRAVIRGTAINNDGSSKVGFTAPSIDSQAAVIVAAQSLAGIDPETIGYVEAHGTGTAVGDPIEVAGLTQAFHAHTSKLGFCALGSVKANIGHLDAAAGVAGLIRAVLALEHREIPPSINFERPNPKLELESTPFYVPTRVREWSRNGTPRRAGVSSLGVGGTNAHVVLEEAPERAPTRAARSWQLLPVSARSEQAMEQALDRLAEYLEQSSTPAARRVQFADVAYTLQVGRRSFDVRRALVCQGIEDAAQALRHRDPKRLLRPLARPTRRRPIFLFGGGGTQYPDMGLELYRHEQIFSDAIDRCAKILAPRLGVDIRHALYPTLHPTAVTEPDRIPIILSGLVATSYALARLWRSWGVEPEGMIGHSMGEYVAACLAGVFTLEQTLALAIKRGELFESVAPGAMMVVCLSPAELAPLLEGRLSLAAVNAPEICLVSGPREAIADLSNEMEAREVESQRVHIAVASHSFLMDPVLDEFTDFVRTLEPRDPEIPFISGVTGTWIRKDEARDPVYWARHLRQTVRFADGLQEVLRDPERVLLEVGPGNALCTLASSQGIRPAPVALPSLRHARDVQSDLAFLLGTVGKLWMSGFEVDWDRLHAPSRPRREPLPTYPFERRRHWIAAGKRRFLAAEDVEEGFAAATADDGDEAEPAEEMLDAPRTERERQLAGMWREALGVERIGIHDDFFELGGHSLMATHLLRHLRRRFGIQLELRALFETPTLATLAARVDGTSPIPGADLDLAAEVVLDPAICPTAGATAIGGPPAKVLLTGATGFLGAFLCRELLRRTSATVVCLVRAESAAEGEGRILRNLERYGCLEEGAEERLVALTGDLSQERLGLAGAFDELAESIDSIYHCGAWVNFARPYSLLRNTNVRGTAEILRLAAHGRISAVHHVSTLAVLAGAILAGADRVLEDEALPPPEGHDTGYSKSKWVAEGLIDVARSRGIPIAVYRPGLVLGDSESGASNEDDYLTLMIEGCIRFGLAPLREYPLAVATADAVAAMIVHLSLQETSVGKRFHLIQPSPLPWNQLFDHVRANGHEVESVPYDRWRDELGKRIADAGGGGLEPLLGLLSDVADREMPVFDRRNVDRGLTDSRVRCPDIDASQVGIFLRYFARSGWLTSRAHS